MGVCVGGCLISLKLFDRISRGRLIVLFKVARVSVDPFFYLKKWSKYFFFFNFRATDVLFVVVVVVVVVVVAVVAVVVVVDVEVDGRPGTAVAGVGFFLTGTLMPTTRNPPPTLFRSNETQ